MVVLWERRIRAFVELSLLGCSLAFACDTQKAAEQTPLYKAKPMHTAPRRPPSGR
jgi:hypothetical protein